jgi:hypothetical protein
MKRAPIIEAALRSPSPHEDELERLIRLQVGGYITRAEYQQRRDDVLRAQKREAVR